MAPEKLRSLSLSLFKIAVYCGITGILIIVAIPNASYRGETGVVVHIIAFLGLGLVGIMLVSCVVSLISGSIAWIKGKRHCGWIIICAMLLMVPLGLSVVIFY